MSRPATDTMRTPADTTPAQLSAGQAAFFDSVVPALPAGDYQMIVQDTVQVDQEPPATRNRCTAA